MTTLDEVKQLTEKLRDLTERYAEIKQREKVLGVEIESLERTLLNIMDVEGIPRIDMPDYSYTRAENHSLKIPQTEEDKREFFRYLKEKGLFWLLAGVNSASLNSYYKKECERAEAAGEAPPLLPGIGAPTVYYKLRVRKK